MPQPGFPSLVRRRETQQSGNLAQRAVYPQMYLQNLIQRQAVGQAQAPSPGIQTERRDPLTGALTEYPEGQFFKAQGTLKTKALENAKSASLALTILNQSEGTYRRLFGDVLDKGGVEGQQEIAKRYYDGVILKKNPELVAFINDLPNQVSFFQRASQETGNIALQKEIRGGKALPHMRPMEGGPENLFMPDDPKSALQKFQWLRDQFTNIANLNLDQYKTGSVSIPRLNPAISQNQPQNQTKGSQYQVGQEITVGAKRYRVKDLSDPSDPDLEEIQ